MANPTLRVEGLSELRHALQQMSTDAPKELAKANKRIGQIVVAEAVRRAPKGPHQGGGSITPIASAIKSSQLALKVQIVAGGPRTPHAGGTEFGGSIPRHGGGRTHLRRHPYVIPAIQAKLTDVLIAYERALDELIAKFDRS